MNKYRKLLGDRVRSLRDKARWTQEHLAERAKTTSTSVANIENGRVATSIEMLGNLAEAFELSLSEMLNFGEEISPRASRPGAVESLDVLREYMEFASHFSRTPPAVRERIATATPENWEAIGAVLGLHRSTSAKEKKARRSKAE